MDIKIKVTPLISSSSCIMSLSVLSPLAKKKLTGTLRNKRETKAESPPSRYPPEEKPKNPSWGPHNLSSRRYRNSKTKWQNFLMADFLIKLTQKLCSLIIVFSVFSTPPSFFSPEAEGKIAFETILGNFLCNWRKSH